MSIPSRSPSERIAQAYDHLPYYLESATYCHPENLAVYGTVFNLEPAPPACCRVLEIACGRGANLAAMAFGLPGSEFVGVDLSSVHIADAARLVESLGLGNVDLRRLDIMDIDDSFGRFDYIIAQGVYSWVPDAVQDKILSVMGRLLNPGGLAYVNYATYPGSHLADAMREMLLYHLDGVDEPGERLREGRRFLELMHSQIQGSGHYGAPYVRYLLDQVDRRAHNFYHEYLNVETRPTYFHRFVERIAGHGLKYVAEAWPPLKPAMTLKPALRREFSLIPDYVRREQYLDFFRDRGGRQSLLCRADTPLKRVTRDTVAERFLIAANVDPIKPGDREVLWNDKSLEYQTHHVGGVVVHLPEVKQALHVLGERWPGSMTFAELAAAVESLRSGADAAPLGPLDRNGLRRSVHDLFCIGVIEYRLNAAECAGEIGDHPRLGALSRLLLDVADTDYVTNARHESIRLDGARKVIARLLDGSRSLDAIRGAAMEMARDGTIAIRERGEPVVDENRLREKIFELVDDTLRFLLNSSLLIT